MRNAVVSEPPGCFVPPLEYTKLFLAGQLGIVVYCSCVLYILYSCVLYL